MFRAHTKFGVVDLSMKNNQQRPALTGLTANAGGTRNAPFDRLNVWVFDLDNTLYPADINLFAQVDQRMGAFIAAELGVSLTQARQIQKNYYYQYGTTLAGLMKIHGVKPKAFLDFVHDIDLTCVREMPKLRTSIENLPGRKLIFSNGARGHAERVAGRLICSIESCNYIPKPSPEAFSGMISRHNVEPDCAAMFEDLPHNLEPAHALGMTTVLVHSDYIDHPAQLKIKTWTCPPKHIHFMTDDLTDFLSKTCGGAARGGGFDEAD